MIMNKLTLCTRAGLCVAALHSMRSGESSTSFIWILMVIQIHAYHFALASTSSTATRTLKETGREIYYWNSLAFSSMPRLTCLLLPGWSHWYSIRKLGGRLVSDRIWCHVDVWDPCSGAQWCALLCPRHIAPLVSAVPHHTSQNTGRKNRIEQLSKLEITEQHLAKMCECMYRY